MGLPGGKWMRREAVVQDSRVAGPVRKRSGWTRKARIGAVAAAIAVGIGAIAMPIADAQIDGTRVDADIRTHKGTSNTIISCTVGGNAINLAAWSCFGPEGHYFGWWLVPNYLVPTDRVAHPEQVPKIAEDGSFNGDLDATLAALLAVASRGQAANIQQADWNTTSAAQAVKDAASPTSGTSATDYVKAAISGGCPESMELTARAGYYLFLVQESPSQGSCNVFDTLRASYEANGSTGMFGAGLRDTIWAWYAIASFASQDPVAADFKAQVGGPVSDYIKSQQKTGSEAAGSFGDAPVIDFRTTAEAVMALLSNGASSKDQVVVDAINSLVTHQNDDGGFGYLNDGAVEGDAERVPLTQTLQTAPVSAMGNALGKGAADPAAMLVFTKGPPWINNLKTNCTPDPAAPGCVKHSGHQAIIEILADYLLRQPGCAEDGTCEGPGLRYDPATQDGEGRFRHSVGDIDFDPATPPDSEEEILDTRPTSDAAFGILWYHPITGVTSDNDISPTDICVTNPEDPSCTQVGAVTAQPNVTG